MQRSRLKNIINKSKEISSTPRDSYDLFVKSLPQELNYYKDGGKYRLKAAWEAYGKPKDYQDALWLGLVETIGGKLSMPSIGYNEKEDSYEYLNTGKENDIVAKDIRVWDNDVIPFVKELKQGGYIRTFNEDKNCWTYSKNEYKRTDLLATINKFLNGGLTLKQKTKLDYYNFLKTLPPNLQKGNVDDGDGIINKEGYRMELLFQNSPYMWTFEDGVKQGIFTLNDSDGVYHSGSIIQMPDGNYEFLKHANHPTTYMEVLGYKNHPAMSDFRKEYDLVTTDENGNQLDYYKYIKRTPQAFKQGGQMNVIPEGALHARKNGMELAKEGEVTHKGIPVVDNNGNLQAEIEREEIIYSKETTDTIEEAYEEYSKEDTSQLKKDEIAIRIGKFLTKEILENTQDNTGLILKVAEQQGVIYGG